MRLAARPALAGVSTVAVPPFGAVSAHTHLGLVAFRATLDSVDVGELDAMLSKEEPAAGHLPRTPATLGPLERQARASATAFLVRAGLLGLAGGVAATVLFGRRSLRRLARCALGGLLATTLLFGPALLTFDVAAFRAPRYQGALESAPALIGDAQTGLVRLRTLRQEMIRISGNLNRAYAALSRPMPSDDSTVRILHISDIHLNPAGFDLAERLADQFQVAAVVDTGDMGTWGLPPERAVPRRVAEFKVPYLFVKGNHDNQAMVDAVAANANARVLDRATVEVAGIRFYGVADPTFSPGQGYRSADLAAVKRARSVGVGTDIDAQPIRPDVLLVHDPALATYAMGHVATVLDGHLHRFSSGLVNGTRELTSGSVGAAGPDGLRSPVPVPSTAEIVSFDPGTRRPVAVDHIMVHSLESSFSVDRELLPEGGTPFAPNPVLVPPGLSPIPDTTAATQAERGPTRHAPAIG